MNNIFQIYGSASSQDIDVLVFEDYLPHSIQERAELCKVYNTYFSSFFQTKKIINSNIAIVENGVLVQVHKGIPDELNNALFLTYELHQQYFPNQIQELVTRDVELKIIRCARVILSFLTRTIYRQQVKLALRGNFKEKIEVLSAIKISQIQDFGKNQLRAEVLKTIAFQLGQTLALMEGKELFTKEEVANYLPRLSSFLQRKDIEVAEIQEVIELFVQESFIKMPTMKAIKE